MNVVYVLGAGVSRHAGIPMLNDFLHVARRQFFGSEVETDSTDHFCYETVFREIAKLEHCGTFVNFDFHNLEEVFGLMDMADALGTSGPANNPTLSCFKKMIRSVIERVTPDTSVDSVIWTPYKAFVEGFLRGHGATAITFNYDELFESLVVDYRNGGRYLWIDHVRKKPEKDASQNAIEILKLHGSIGWGGDHPTIIPPTWSKSLRDGDTRGVFEPIWKRAREVIQEAERIVFIGYSLPATDQYFRQFLAFALSRNDRLQDVIVINPDRDVNDRFRGLLNEHFRRSYHFFDVEFEIMFGGHYPQDREKDKKRSDCIGLLNKGR